MATWPATLPKCSIQKGYGGKPTWQTLATPFEAGYEQTRALSTRNRSEWTGGMVGLTAAQFLAFTSFVDEVKYAADSWEWTDYRISTAASTHTVRFIDHSIQWRRGEIEVFDVSFGVREV